VKTKTLVASLAVAVAGIILCVVQRTVPPTLSVQSPDNGTLHQIKYAAPTPAPSLLDSIGNLGSPPMPPPIYDVSAVCPGGRMVKMRTFSKSVYDSLQLDPFAAGGTTVTVAATKIAIRSDDILVNDESVAAIPPGTRVIQLAEKNGAVQIMADGINLYEIAR